MTAATTRLEKADTVALWHAVDDMALMVKVMKDGSFTDEQIQAAERRLSAAKKALAKCNAIRKAMTAPDVRPKSCNIITDAGQAMVDHQIGTLINDATP